MANRNYSNLVDSREKDIEKLHGQLYAARRTILNLMPLNIMIILTNYSSCESRKATYEWRDNVIEAIILEAEILSPKKGFSFQERAYCPLCGNGSFSYYDEDYIVPEGLRRHLVGFGNTRQCEVMFAVCELARECWHDKFNEAEQAEQIEKSKHEKQRKLTEITYLTNPNYPPELINLNSPFGKARSDEGMIGSENRLIELGFKINQKENV